MKKKEFKKLMKKENKEFKNYYLYEMIIIIFLVLLCILNIILDFNEIIPSNVFNINLIFTLIVAIPMIIIDMLNDIQINKMYKQHEEENKIPEYKNKTKLLKILVVLSIIITIIESGIILNNILSKDNETISEIENILEITSNKGNIVQTQYENFGGFSLKIPTDFKIMNDEMLKIKYPTGNPPSLVYTNERGTINIALVMNDVAMENTQIEEYTKLMESTYKEYSKDTKINFWERNNHKIGELEFITQASDTEIYNHIIAFSIDGKLRLVNFNCTRELYEEWKDISKFIIDSIKFANNGKGISVAILESDDH